MKFQKFILTSVLCIMASFSSIQADEYVIDTKGGHASIDFRFKHLNISWLTGTFNEFEGNYSFDAANMGASKVELTINTSSVDSGHAERDKHMRGEKYLGTTQFPTAKFVSSKVSEMDKDGGFTVTGNLTLHGVTKEVAIKARKIGEGKDPWGGYRSGFKGHFQINTLDFGMKFPPSSIVEMSLFLEGKRK